MGSPDSRVPPVSDSKGLNPGALSVLSRFSVLKVFPENGLNILNSISLDP